MKISSKLLLFLLVTNGIRATTNSVNLNSNNVELIEKRISTTEEYPFLADIPYNQADNNHNDPRLMGGGVIVHGEWVLTSQNTFDCHEPEPKLSQIGVRVGIVPEDAKLQQKFLVDRVITHYRYRNDQTRFNVALVKVRAPFHLTREVSIAKLAKTPQKINHRRHCFVLGLKKRPNTKYPTDTYEVVKIKLRLLNNRECLQKLAKTGHRFWERNMCLESLSNDENEQKELCSNKAGFPVICGSEVQGLLSNYSMKTCSEDRVLIVPDVGYHPNWIKSVTENFWPILGDLTYENQHHSRRSDASHLHNFGFKFLKFLLLILLL